MNDILIFYKRNKALIYTTGFALVATLILMFGIPKYRIWYAEQVGKAELAKQENLRQIQVAQAEGELAASQIRAQAIETVGAMAQRYPEYRIQELYGALGEAMVEGKIEQIIYLPTESMLPITEATRFQPKEESEASLSITVGSDD